MDLTQDFLFHVERYRGMFPAPPSRPIQTTTSLFSRMAKEVLASISHMQSLLLQYSPSFVDFENGMSETERDRLIVVLSEALKQAEDRVRHPPLLPHNNNNPAQQDHENHVSLLLLSNLTSVKEQVNLLVGFRTRRDLSGLTKLVNATTQEIRRPTTLVIQEEEKEFDFLHDLSETERQELIAENRALEEKLNTELEDIHALEKQAHTMQELFDVFSSKVMDQHQIIGSVLDDSHHAVDVIHLVPAELQKTAEHSRGYRRFLLMLFFVSGVLILLLDWANS